MEQKSQKLHKKLSNHKGITEIIVAPYEKFVVVQDQCTHEFTGPARVLFNQKAKEHFIPETAIGYCLGKACENGTN